MSSEYRMSEKLDFETIALRMKKDLKNPANRIEGSFASDNIQAVAKEILKYYYYVDFLQDQHYAETAIGNYLDKKAMEVGVFRKKATRAKGLVTFEGRKDTYIPKDFRVYSDSFTYITVEDGFILDDGKLSLNVEAEKEGSLYNLVANSIYKFDAGISGLSRVYNTDPIRNGSDLENDDLLRERTLLRMRYPGTSGNQYHYMHWAMEVEGVGRVKVFPVWDGPGTVKVSILDANQRVANENLIKSVKKHIDNDGDRKGESLAPIGALLTVTSASVKALNVTGSVILQTGSKLKKEDLSERLKDDLQKYIDKYISYKSSRLTVAKVIDILYQIEGVLDIDQLKVNGVNDSISFEQEEIGYVESVVLD